MVADVVVMLDEGIDLPFEISGQIIVVEQDAVLEGLVPPFDCPVGLRVIRSAAHMLNALVRDGSGTTAKLDCFTQNIGNTMESNSDDMLVVHGIITNIQPHAH